LGLADRIVDLVETGNTLKAHDLVELDVIAHSTARLIVNRASLKLKYQTVTALLEALRSNLPGNGKAAPAARSGKRPRSAERGTYAGRDRSLA
jgi:ATP phosphoribosyltransferase